MKLEYRHHWTGLVHAHEIPAVAAAATCYLRMLALLQIVTGSQMLEWGMLKTNT